MISTRTAQLKPATDHPSRKVTIINLINYDLYQYVDNEQPPTAHLSQQVSNNKSKEHILNTMSTKDKVVNNGEKLIGTEGVYNILLIDGKKYLKHKFKKEPLKVY